MLSNDERELLKLVAQAGVDVRVLPVLNPAEPGMDENHPGHEAWTERQMAWYGVSISLWKRGLVHVVVPADGSRGDLVEPTGEGRRSGRCGRVSRTAACCRPESDQGDAYHGSC